MNAGAEDLEVTRLGADVVHARGNCAALLWQVDTLAKLLLYSEDALHLALFGAPRGSSRSHFRAPGDPRLVGRKRRHEDYREIQALDNGHEVGPLQRRKFDGLGGADGLES